MSILNKQERIAFNPAKKEHREAIKRFMVRKAWADTDLRFAHDPNYESLVEQTQTELLKWYMEKDLNKAAKAK